MPWALLLNRYTLALALMVGAAWGFQVYRQSLIQIGYDQAITEVEAKQVDIERELKKERSRLISRIYQLEKENAEEEALVAKFRDRSAAAAQRLRDQEHEFDARLTRANAEALRAYAKDSDGNLEGCRQDLGRFAAEAGSCSSTAHTLKKYIDALP